MAYYPLNRTKTNSYTPGKEFIILSTKKPYTGYYWEDYEGKFFTGKTPNDPSPLELIPIPKQTPLDTPNIVLYVTSSITNSNYNNLKNIDTNVTRFTPISYFPSPTEKDYNVGMFNRYFLAKVNENVYIEVNKPTYESIKSKSPDWIWELYIPFILPWTLIGDQDKVYNTNGNIVRLTEQRLQRSGLSLFLKNNYLKFYKET